MNELIEIKQYSTSFATKLNYLVEKYQATDKLTGNIKAIEHVLSEKSTTVKNWLFNSKLPRVANRLVIADALGVSVEYLFDNGVALESIEKPKSVMVEGCYHVPFIDESSIFSFSRAEVIPIVERVPMMFPFFPALIDKFGPHIYATKIEKSNFKPHVNDQSMLLYTEKPFYEEYKFLLFEDEAGKSFLKRVIRADHEYKLLSYNTKGEEVIQSIPTDKKPLSILLSISQ